MNPSQKNEKALAALKRIEKALLIVDYKPENETMTIKEIAREAIATLSQPTTGEGVEPTPKDYAIAFRQKYADLPASEFAFRVEEYLEGKLKQKYLHGVIGFYVGWRSALQLHQPVAPIQSGGVEGLDWQVEVRSEDNGGYDGYTNVYFICGNGKSFKTYRKEDAQWLQERLLNLNHLKTTQSAMITPVGGEVVTVWWMVELPQQVGPNKFWAGDGTSPDYGWVADWKLGLKFFDKESAQKYRMGLRFLDSDAIKVIDHALIQSRVGGEL